MYEFSSMLKKLEITKMFFTAVEIVPFEVDRNLRGLIPFGIESILQYVESHSKFSPVGKVEQINLLQSSQILHWSQLPPVKNMFSRE
jgi:hypothetical protein